MKAFGRWGSRGKSGELKSVYDESGLYTGTHNTTSLGSVVPFAKQAVVFAKASGASLKNIKQRKVVIHSSPLPTHHSLDSRVNNCPYDIQQNLKI